MDSILYAFFIGLLVVFVFAAIMVTIRQLTFGKGAKNSTVSGSDNHMMKQRSGKYSICKSIGEANAEF